MSKKKIGLIEYQFNVLFTVPSDVKEDALKDLLSSLDTRDAEIVVTSVTLETKKVYYA